MMHWHTLNAEAIFRQLGSSAVGLSIQSVPELQIKYGKNILEEKKKRPAWMLFLHQFSDFMIIVLFIAALVSGIAGDRSDMIIILAIVLLNAIVGFVQEFRAEKAMESLKKMATLSTTAIRGGNIIAVSSEELVPGDIVLLEAGNTIPADIRLLETSDLRTVESSLTGESLPVDKHPAVLESIDLPLGDLTNMAFRGTQVIHGRGKGIVVTTGMHTELGQIASMLQQQEGTTPLQKRMADFGKKLSWLIIVICIILFGVGLLRGEGTLKMLLLSISLAVAAIPEALPVLITIALARGAKRLVEKNVLIKKLPAVETLGSVTFICSDKTGTLTQNKMTVVEMRPALTDLNPVSQLTFLETAMLLNQDTRKESDGKVVGDPTEIAMVNYFQDENLPADLQHQFPRVAELAFDSNRKLMTTIHKFQEGFILITKGAAESVAAILAESEENKYVISEAALMAANGIRVLGYCYRYLDSFPSSISSGIVETDMHFAGLVGVADPPREEIKEAIKECQAAGIYPVMITGDHKETAAAIARQIGILNKGGLVISGTELSRSNPDELEELIERIRVYARVSPQQKLDIVRALQKKEHFVAMTGDGVNDAPSLKTADIGIAMGITGTDVSKEAADMILLDDNFATIVKAVKEGRRIYDNIRRFVKYIMTCNSAEIWTILLAPLVGLPIPLLPIHILWINLITDGLPGLALSAEKAERDVMHRPPRKPSESLFSEGVGIHITWVGLLMAFLTLSVQAWAIHNEIRHWQTMVFTVLSLTQLGHVMAIRSDHEYIYRKGLLSNLPLFVIVLSTFLLQLATIYLPLANKLLKTQPLTFAELSICIGVAAILFHAVEAEKWVRNYFKQKNL